ncbi:conserved hypothetical protein [Candidatus Glomeribacter gigasporarum BEG34]|uniref:Uncharacterized protein n=1 Tax=Candidatus Glomeribacter gigasporarum BEG34 TaxID=1070319 RepID=G2JAT1_9BURK|nr:hypothetical protein [Candidatus Glomeribacter gigasporarum]CCD29883.1 conserved hypothetical protein [Candidatus Glomeribacter gigasporarum BEG34]
MDFKKPELQDHYAAVLRVLRGQVALLARWLEDATPDHTPVGVKRWSEANKRFEHFDGAAWQSLAKRYQMNVEQLAGRTAGNQAEQIPISNGKINQNLNAEQLGGQNAAYYASQAEMQTRVSKAGDAHARAAYAGGRCDRTAARGDETAIGGRAEISDSRRWLGNRTQNRGFCGQYPHAGR